MQGEPASFGPVCNLLRRNCDPAVYEDIDSIRARYNGFLNGNAITFQLHGDFEGTVVGPRGIFENWLYYGSFHQDLSRQAIYEELSRWGPQYVYAVNAVALTLAGCVMELDDLIASVLGEPRMPRIGVS
jgi:hypothetical protein